MDIDLLRTFLEVHRTRHFGKAADNLYVTQSAVSARIRLLEETVGVPLFERTRNNIQLTPAGQRLVRHAESIVYLWNRARQQITTRNESGVGLAVGGMPSLWDIFLQDWLQAVTNGTGLVANAEFLSAEAQIRMLRDGTLDLGFMFDAPETAEMEIREIASISLVLVASRPDLSVDDAMSSDYVLVDWGASFANTHAREFPEIAPPHMRAGIGRIAHGLIKSRGGAAYLARRAVQPDLDAGVLWLVRDAPVIERRATAVYAENTEQRPQIEAALQSLQHHLAGNP